MTLDDGPFELGDDHNRVLGMSVAFKLRGTTVHERFGEESVIVNLDSGSYYSVLGTGDVIWNLVTSGASESAIVAHMTAQFGDEDADIARLTTEFLNQLVAENLVGAVAATSGEPPITADRPNGSTFAPPLLQKYSDMEELLQLDPIHEVDDAGWPHRKAPA